MLMKGPNILDDLLLDLPGDAWLQLMTPIVIRSEGIILSTISGGASPMIASISAVDDGRVPPFACLRRSTTLTTRRHNARFRGLPGGYRYT